MSGSPRIAITLETYGAHDDGPDVVRVAIDDQEVGAYCIADDSEAERASMEAMVRAAEQVGRDAARAQLASLAQAVIHGRGAGVGDAGSLAREVRDAGLAGYAPHDGECRFANGSCLDCGRTSSGAEFLAAVDALGGLKLDGMFCDDCGDLHTRCDCDEAPNARAELEAMRAAVAELAAEARPAGLDPEAGALHRHYAEALARIASGAVSPGDAPASDREESSDE